MSIQFYCLHRLMTILCATCFVQLAIVGSCLSEVSKSAQPNVDSSKGSTSDSVGAAPHSDKAKAADSPKAKTADSPKAKAADSPKAKAADSPKAKAADSPVKVDRASESDEQHTSTKARTTIGSNPPDEPKNGVKGRLTSNTMSRVLARFAPSITNFYRRSVAEFNTSNFGHSLGFWGAVDYIATPSLIFSTSLGVYNEIGEEYERFVASNWFFSATKTFKLPLVGILYPRFFFNLPTNPDASEYLTYRGSVGMNVELRKFNLYRFHKDHSFGGAVGFASERNMYETAFNKGGGPNTLWNLSGSAALTYKFRRSLIFIVRYRNNWRWGPEGARADDLFRLSSSINYSPIKQIWLALSMLSEDRTFLYDQVSSNVSFYSPESTSVIFSLTYLPKLSIVNELSR